MDTEAIFIACLSVDKDIRSKGELALKELSRQPSHILAVLHLLHSSESVQVRLLAALHLKKKIPLTWRQLSDQEHNSIKAGLQCPVVEEQDLIVRKVLCELLAATASVVLPAGEWQELLPWLYQCTRSSIEIEREVALVVFSSLTSYISEHLRAHHGILKDICSSGLVDASPRVRRAALVAVGALTTCITDGPETRFFKDIVPMLLQAIQGAISAGDDETTVEALHVLTGLIESPSPPQGPLLPQLVTCAVELAWAPSHSLMIRQAALQMLEGVAGSKPKQFVTMGLVKPVVAALCTLCAEIAPEDWEEDMEDPPARVMASQALDVLAQELPSKHVFPDVLAYAKSAIESANMHERGAACTVLLVVVEGCSRLARDSLEAILQVIVAGLHDKESSVRKASVAALGQLAEHCQPELVHHARTVLPAIFIGLADPDEAIQDQACYALQTVCEHLEDGVLEYLQPLMVQLGEILQHGKLEAKISAFDAISSAASAAGSAFEPYVAPLLPVLRNYMQTTETDLLSCRGSATQCLGLVCEAVGPDVLRSMLPDFITAALQGFQLEHGELREYTHFTMSHLAKALGQEFAPWLPAAFAAAFSSLTLDDGASNSKEDSQDAHSPVSTSLASDSSEDDEDEELKARLKIHTAVLEEKAAAMMAVGVYAEVSLAAFAPYLERSLSLATGMSAYFHEDLREQAYTTMPSLLNACLAAFPAPSGVLQQAQHLINTAMPVLLGAVEDDDEQEAVTAAITAMGPFLQTEACNIYAQEVSAAILKILRGQALCQEVPSDDEASEDTMEDAEETEDDILISAVCELLPALVKSMGPSAYASSTFAEEHWKELMTCMKASKPLGIRAAAMGTVAELVLELHHCVPSIGDKIAPIIHRELRASDVANRRNAAFCLGVLCQECSSGIHTHLNALLQALHPLFSPQEVGEVRDNACGALARLVSSPIAGQLPLDQLLATMLEALPLTEDLEEADVVYGALCSLASNEGFLSTVQPIIPNLFQAFGNVLVQHGISQTVVGHVAEVVQGLKKKYGECVLRSLSLDQRSALDDLTNRIRA